MLSLPGPAIRDTGAKCGIPGPPVIPPLSAEIYIQDPADAKRVPFHLPTDTDVPSLCSLVRRAPSLRWLAKLKEILMIIHTIVRYFQDLHKVPK